MPKVLKGKELLEEVKTWFADSRFLYWVENREVIRRKRLKGLPAPWSDDPILNTYRFCNVRRMDDKVSVWLYENWYKPYFNHPNMIYAVALARFINKPETLTHITEEVFTWKGKPNWRKVKSLLRSIRSSGATIFNAAYMVRGNDGEDKIDSVVDFYTKPLDLKMIDPDSMRATWSNLVQSYGLGSFMAGQLTADLRWAVYGTFKDRKIWAPAGPGSLRGIKRYGELNSVKEKDFPEYLLHLIEECEQPLSLLLSEDFVSKLEAHDWQNCLCEFDKYERVLWGEGKPKQLYRSVS